MKKIILFFLLSSVPVFAQSVINYKGENINRLDGQGNKVGLWKLYSEHNKVLITVDYDDRARVNFYKDTVLVASYFNDVLEIYKDSKTIKATFFYKENKSQGLRGEDGRELDPEITKYYTQAAEVHPMFYGGRDKLFAYIGSNFKKKRSDEGKIKVKFAIDTNGYVKDITIAESTVPELNDEAIRVIKTLPRWQPGFQGGNFVNVSYMVPIVIQKN